LTPRIYCPVPLESGADVELPREAGHHAVRVLRLKAGEAITLFDGHGAEFAAELAAIEGRAVVARVGARSRVDRESPLDVTVVHGLAGTDRMDYAIQKTVELGVRAIVPVATTRSVVQLDARRAEKRVEHWRAIAIASCEQCGRNVLPEIAPVRDFRHWIADASAATTRLLLAPGAAEPLAGIARPPGATELLVGPEGGFTDEETSAALRAGFRAVHVGPRVLRTETAAAAALAAMNALWGDWR
jgi:16S rRNA (uracil1498-N3)-methyltransferase